MSRKSNSKPASQRHTALALATALAFGAGSLLISPSTVIAASADAGSTQTIPTRISPTDAARLEKLKAWQASQPKSNSSDTPLAGTTWTVSSCDDDGPGTLRDILENWADDGDIVDMSGQSCTINLQSSLVTSANSLTIKANPEHKYDISGGNQHRIIEHNGTGTLTLDGVSILQGRASQNSAFGATGGCIRSSGGVKLINKSEAKYCVAENTTGGYASGGAIRASGLVTIDTSTIRSSKAVGNVAAFGGAIDTQGQISLSAASIRNNQASSPSLVHGGALYAGGGLTAKYSELQGNKATISGSGASQANASGGAVWIKSNTGINIIHHSTFSGNTAGHGAALLLGGLGSAPTTGSTLIQQSTIANNRSLATSEGAAGAIAVRHKTTIQNSTISGNTEEHESFAKYGAGIHIDGNTSLTLSSTLVADNTTIPGGSYGDASDIVGDYNEIIPISGGNNLVRFYLGVDLPDDTLTTDPQLQALADNGGPTLTMALPPDSPAIDKGKTNSQTTDQRGTGFVRKWGAAADIGAFEYQPIATIDIFIDDFED